MAPEQLDDRWYDYIDSYCERIEPGFWAEPVNALTNIAFLIAAVMLWRKYRQLPHSRQGLMLQLLIMNIFIIGIGSFVFHTIATRWAMMADVIPITIFIYLALAIYLRDLFGFNALKVILGVVGYLIFGGVLYSVLPHGALNGSLDYAAAFILLIALAVGTYKKGHKVTSHYLVMAAVVFLFSVTLRTLDMQVCKELTVGIHFMWHILNSVVLYYIGLGLVSNTRWMAEKDGISLR